MEEEDFNGRDQHFVTAAGESLDRLIEASESVRDGRCINLLYTLYNHHDVRDVRRRSAPACPSMWDRIKFADAGKAIYEDRTMSLKLI